MIEYLHFDYETFSEISIKDAGAHRYARDTSTEVLCVAYAIDDEDPILWTPYDDEPTALFRAMRRCKHFVGHNVNFEIQIWKHVCEELYGWPRINTDKAIDTAAMAAMHSIPRSLDGACKAMEVKHQKSKEGHRIMLKLSKPRKPSKKNPATRWTIEAVPNDYQKLYDYCIDDVYAERDLHHSLSELPKREQELWQLDRTINDRGVRVQEETLEGAIEIIETVKKKLEQEASYIAAGAFNATTQREKVMEWALAKGYPLENYTADYLDEVIKDDECPDNVRRVIQIRRMTSRTSVKKYYAMQRALCEDGTIKGTLMYHGAGTGRWAGRIIQPQNFPRPTIKENDISLAIELMQERDDELLYLLFNGDPTDTMVSCIRGTIIPKEDNVFYCGDFANVEGRILLWCAGDTDGLNIFRSGLDLYKDMACTIYDIEYIDVDSDQRRMGKLAILGLGYAMGWKKFMAQCALRGVIVTAKFAKKVVDAYRKKFKKVTEWWDELESAAKKAICNPGKVYRAGPVSYRMGKKFLRCKLPSGRYLYYPDPDIREMTAPWGGTKPTITYMVEDKKRWVRTKTFGGKLAENVVQAISRDLLREAMFRVEPKGYEITLTVHDEILAERKKGTGSEKEFKHLMEILPDWAAGAFIEAEIWIGMRYKK